MHWLGTWLYSLRVRSIFYQAVLFVLVAIGFYSLITNMQVNMESRGISTGFDFLWNKAGFDIGFTLFDYDSGDTYFKTFLVISFINPNFVIKGFINGIVCRTHIHEFSFLSRGIIFSVYSFLISFYI